MNRIEFMLELAALLQDSGSGRANRCNAVL